MQGISRRPLGILLSAVWFAGCGSSPAPNASTPIDEPPDSRFDLANGCYVLRANDQYVVRDGAAFVASGADASSAEHFFMKPANLSRYLFYTVDEQLMTAQGLPLIHI